MATPKKSEVGGTPDSTIAIMATTNFYSNCHSNVFTELPLPDSKALSNIQYMLDLSFTDPSVVVMATKNLDYQLTNHFQMYSLFIHIPD